MPIPADNGWLECLRSQTEELVATCPADCFVSPSILRGHSDVSAALRGLNGFFLDLYDAPDLVSAALERVGSLLRESSTCISVLSRQSWMATATSSATGRRVRPILIQEDMMGLASPDLFRDLFLEHEARLVEHLGPYTFFHVHSTGYAHYGHVLEIPGLAGVELTVETNGPSLWDLIPGDAGDPATYTPDLFVDAYFEELSEVARHFLAMDFTSWCPTSSSRAKRTTARCWPALGLDRSTAAPVFPPS